MVHGPTAPRPAQPFLNPRARERLTHSIALPAAGYKRAFCFGPEDRVMDVKKEMKNVKFEAAIDKVIITSPTGAVMEDMKELSEYGIKKGDVLKAAF